MTNDHVEPVAQRMDPSRNSVITELKTSVRRLSKTRRQRAARAPRSTRRARTAGGIHSTAVADPIGAPRCPRGGCGLRLAGNITTASGVQGSGGHKKM